MKHERRVSHVAGAGGARGPQQRAQLVRGGGERVRGQTVELVKAPPRAAQRNAAQQATHTFRVHCLKITLILCNILILLKKQILVYNQTLTHWATTASIIFLIYLVHIYVIKERLRLILTRGLVFNLYSLRLILFWESVLIDTDTGVFTDLPLDNIFFYTIIALILAFNSIFII